MLKILIVEDEAHNREILTEILSRLGHETMTAVDGSEALERCASRAFDLVLTDVRMPRMSGLELHENFIRLYPSSRTQFAFMTAYGRIEEAVEAMRKGAVHFLSKPLKKKDLVSLCEEVEKEFSSSLEVSPAAENLSDLVYASRAFSEIVELVDRVAQSQANVLFVGESGTGKELLSHRLHAKSTRSSLPFIAFHCGAMPESLWESELFGFEKGSFTGADASRKGQIRLADKGSFFLDELSTMPLAVQAKLLRVLQDGRVQPLGATSSVECDVRWIGATNRDLDGLAAKGEFREDLLFRLSVVVIDVPPLRDRTEDVDALLDHYLAHFADRERKAQLRPTGEVRELLRSYPWPGNARELRNVVERAYALAPNDVWDTALLPQQMATVAASREIKVALGSTLESAEDKLIEETLKMVDGDKARAAGILGVAPRTIYRWLERKGPGA